MVTTDSSRLANPCTRVWNCPQPPVQYALLAPAINISYHYCRTIRYNSNSRRAYPASMASSASLCPGWQWVRESLPAVRSWRYTAVTPVDLIVTWICPARSSVTNREISAPLLTMLSRLCGAFRTAITRIYETCEQRILDRQLREFRLGCRDRELEVPVVNLLSRGGVWLAGLVVLVTSAAACSSGGSSSVAATGSAAASAGGVPAAVTATLNKYLAEPVFAAPGPAVDVAKLRGKKVFVIPIEETPFTQAVEAGKRRQRKQPGSS